MKKDYQISCYCFNPTCNSSIFHPQSCIVTRRSFIEAAASEINCSSCGSQLVSAPILCMSRLLGEALHLHKPLKSFIIDDDLSFQILAKDLFDHSSSFSESQHLTSAHDALDYLTKNLDQPELIPDYIFLDVNMPTMDAWGFLEEFDHILPNLSKKISIYVITSNLIPAYRERIKHHPSVKAVITKDFDLEFLNSIT